MEKKTPKLVWYDALKTQVENAKAQSQYKISYKMKPEDIAPFISGLHKIQADMIETTVAMKEKQGFPEASAVIKHIMDKK